MWVEPITLQGRFVRLEPLAPNHAADLYEAAQNDEIWLYTRNTRPESLEHMQKLIATAQQSQASGSESPFAIIDMASGRAIGSTRYLDIQPANRGLEIGFTWLGRPYWKSPRNTECKYLLLSHAFDQLSAIRVCLKTDSRNTISQNAIERIGGVKEGVLRNHMIYPNGYIRDTVYYSILDREWPTVKANLEAKLATY